MPNCVIGSANRRGRASSPSFRSTRSSRSINSFTSVWPLHPEILGASLGASPGPFGYDRRSVIPALPFIVLQFVASLGAGWLLWTLWKECADGRAITTAGFVVRVCAGLPLFLVSYFQLP